MPRKPKIIINKSKNKQFYLTIKAANNETLAHTETYKKMPGAKKAAKALKRVVKGAQIINKSEKK